MNISDPAIQWLAYELAGILFLIVVWSSIKARRKKKNRVKVANALIKAIQNQKSKRIEQLKLVLSQQYF
ncbi:MAG TPA: hypothetical protein DCR13_04290, partial [Gammaproteobacteria bacterium]|nr:hypothetical protein [Gammaproteobacteria bacterium]